MSPVPRGVIHRDIVDSIPDVSIAYFRRGEHCAGIVGGHSEFVEKQPTLTPRSVTN